MWQQQKYLLQSSGWFPKGLLPSKYCTFDKGGRGDTFLAVGFLLRLFSILGAEIRHRQKPRCHNHPALINDSNTEPRPGGLPITLYSSQVDHRVASLGPGVR
jgi:hypothetical protein